MTAPRLWTAQCSHAAYYANTVTVEASSPEEACERAIEEANGSDGWKSLDHCGPTFVDAIAPGDVDTPWCKTTHGSVLPVPAEHAEGGASQLAAQETRAFVERVAALTVASSRCARRRRTRSEAERLDFLNAIVAEAKAIRDRHQFPSAGAAS